MILRAWRSFASLTDDERYPQHMLETVQPKLEAIPGFGGLFLLRRRGSWEVVQQYEVLARLARLG